MVSNMKYILVTGGVISGVGKGVIASSLGVILKSCGISVTAIKIDPYINLDAGTFSPLEHGEVFVLNDGGEVDLDLGNYERFLNITLHRDNNITTGKIYKAVIDKERRGDYLGKTVQIVPHITDAIQAWVERVARIPVSDNEEIPQVCIVELGGTIGDIESMPFVEAFRQFQFKAKKDNFCVAHVSLIPHIKTTGEQKTKPTQASIKHLRGLGLSPDLIMCRSERPLDNNVKEKISNFCHVPPKQVICVHDVSSIYKVPLLMESHGMIEYLLERFKLTTEPLLETKLEPWSYLTRKIENLHNEVKIVLVGKYTQLPDAYTSVIKSLQHAAHFLNYKINIELIQSSHLEKKMKIENAVAYHEAWKQLNDCKGVVVPGGFGSRGIEGKIAANNYCRKSKKPCLCICLGFQTAVIEFARNVLKLSNAHSTECNVETNHPVIIDMPEHNTGEIGGTMRLGSHTTKFALCASNSKIKRLYNNAEQIQERHRHRYEVNPKFIDDFNNAGLEFVATNLNGKRMEIFELKDHPYYVGVQFHPEYLTRPMYPSPPFIGLILAANNKLSLYLDYNYKELNPSGLDQQLDQTAQRYPGEEADSGLYDSIS